PKDLKVSSVYVCQSVLVCLDCGFTELSIPTTELLPLKKAKAAAGLRMAASTRGVHLRAGKDAGCCRPVRRCTKVCYASPSGDMSCRKVPQYSGETLKLPPLAISEPFPYPTPALPVTSPSVPAITPVIVSPASTYG